MMMKSFTVEAMSAKDPVIEQLSMINNDQKDDDGDVEMEACS